MAETNDTTASNETNARNPWAACMEATGSAFLANHTRPTTAQMRKMCHSSDCISDANGYIMTPRSRIPNWFQPELRPIFHDFVDPLVDFCYFFRKPDDPCPADFVGQFLTDFKDLVTVCEKKSGFSFKNLPPKVSYSGENQAQLRGMCGVDECNNLMKRLDVKLYVETCQPFRAWDRSTVEYPPDITYPADYMPILDHFVSAYTQECDVYGNRDPVWYYSYAFASAEYMFVELPGPLPADPLPLPPAPSIAAVVPTSMPSPSPTPLLDTTVPPAPSSPAPSLKPSETSPTRVIPRSSSPPQIADRSTTIEPLNVSNTTVPSTNRLPKAASRVNVSHVVNDTTIVSQPSGPPAPTDAPAILLSTDDSSNNHSLLWATGSCAVLAVVLLAVFIFRRRRHNPKPDHSYRSFDDSSDQGTLSQETGPLHGLPLSCTEIPAHQLADIRVVGGGGFGVVYLVRETSTNRLLASKRLNKDNQSKVELDAFLAEIELVASLSHPRIVEFVGVAGLNKTELQALYEYMAGGDLKRYLDSQPPIDPAYHSWTSEKLQIAIDVADALVYLHTLEPTPVVHRDLKSRNVMLTSDKRAKLGDFGVSRTESAVGSMTTGVGTSRWVAPEVILGGGDYTTACDIYSFGVVLSELDTHRLPFTDLTHANGEKLTDFALLPMVAMERKQPSFTANCPPSILEMARKCLSFEPASRPTAVDVAAVLRGIQHEFGWEMSDQA